jgi:hypothetical protein
MDSTERYVAERDAKLKLINEQRSAIQEFLQVVGGPTTVRMGGNESDIETRKLQGRNRSAFHATVAADASMLDLLRMAATEMFHTNVEIIDTVTSKLSDPNIGRIAKVIESARVELLGDVWFNTKMAEDSTQKKNARNTEAMASGRDAIYNVHVGGAVEKTVYGLDGTIENDVVRRAMELFKPELRSATMTMDSTAAINVAVDIANYLRIETAKEEEPPGPVGTEKQPGGDDDDEQEPRGEVPERARGTQQVPNVFDKDTGTETPDNTLTYEAPPEVVEETPEELKKRINRNVRSGATRRQNKIEGKNSVKSSAPQTLNTGPNSLSTLYGREHTAISVTVPSEPTPISEYARLALQTYANSATEREIQRLHKRGQPSRHAWKLNLGNTRVFQQPPKLQGHISMLIDISSSMGCWCPACQAQRIDRRTGRARYDNAFLAWQVAATLGQLHPNAEVFAYSSPTRNIGGNMQTAVYPLPAGHQPALCGNTSNEIACGGTPTCAAMLWFKEHLSQRPDSTTAIIITDGAPNGCGDMGSGHHVELIGEEMMSMGMKFGTVFLGGGRYLNLPTEVSVNISNVEQLRDIQPLLTLLDE